MSEELKPCPFCGSKNVMIDDLFDNGTNTVFCGECQSKSSNFCHFDSAIEQWNTRAPQNEWISVTKSKPNLNVESQEDPDSDGYCQFDGMASITVEITDGFGRGFGHYRDDGKWNSYTTDHDIDQLNVDPDKVTHYRAIQPLPKEI